MSTSKNKLSVQTLVRCAMIAAVYTVLCLVLQPFSYGAVQVLSLIHISEPTRPY